MTFNSAKWMILVIYLLLPIPISALDNPPPSPAETGQPPQTQPGETNNGSNTIQSHSGNPVIGEVTNPKQTEPPKNQNTKKRKIETSFNRGDIYNGLIVLFTFVLALSTIGLFIVTCKTANAAEKSANAATESVQILKNNAEMELRAYMSIDRITRTDKLDVLEPPNFDIIIINSGKTPAYNVRISVYAELVDYPPKEEITIPAIPGPPSAGIVGPGITIVSKVNIDGALSNKQNNALISKKTAIFLIGTIKYIDLFGNGRFVDFCFVHQGKRGLGADACPYQEGNNAN